MPAGSDRVLGSGASTSPCARVPLPIALRAVLVERLGVDARHVPLGGTIRGRASVRCVRYGTLKATGAPRRRGIARRPAPLQLRHARRAAPRTHAP